MTARRLSLLLLAMGQAASAHADDEELKRTVELLKAEVQRLAGRVGDLEEQLQRQRRDAARGE
ncbi:hypothetical protein, partial [Methylogaea oryzae]